ncbi:MAG: protein kinase [Vicinamibacterales bacterium]
MAAFAAKGKPAGRRVRAAADPDSLKRLHVTANQRHDTDRHPALRAPAGRRATRPARAVLTSVESGLRYRVGPPLGEGGFGQAYLAVRMGKSTRVPGMVCVKVSTKQDGWLREAYFGLLLHQHPRAVAVFDAFPVVDGGGRLLYCLATEYARHGDLASYLARHPAPWRERVVRREIAGVLQVLGRLHRGQLLHRDLTPMNVFVCDALRLKLGDFGIVRQQGDRKGVAARTLNPLMAPSDVFRGAAPKWQARDDVYQVGQLIGMLVKGDASKRIRTSEVRDLPCTDHLKEIVYRCIGERRKRYESADELVEALTTPPRAVAPGRVATLKGARLVFTGFLGVTRTEAARAAAKAGAAVQSGLSALTTVVVRGRPNRLQAAGRDGGRKLLEVKRLREQGVKVVVISETRFWTLVGRRP